MHLASTDRATGLRQVGRMSSEHTRQSRLQQPSPNHASHERRDSRTALQPHPEQRDREERKGCQDRRSHAGGPSGWAGRERARNEAAGGGEHREAGQEPVCTGGGAASRGEQKRNKAESGAREADSQRTTIVQGTGIVQGQAQHPTTCQATGAVRQQHNHRGGARNGPRPPGPRRARQQGRKRNEPSRGGSGRAPWPAARTGRPIAGGQGGEPDHEGKPRQAGERLARQPARRGSPQPQQSPNRCEKGGREHAQHAGRPPRFTGLRILAEPWCGGTSQARCKQGGHE